LGFVTRERVSVLRCSYCFGEDGALGKCRRCGTLTHADCLQEAGRCPTLGCFAPRDVPRAAPPPAWRPPTPAPPDPPFFWEALAGGGARTETPRREREQGFGGADQAMDAHGEEF